VRVCLSGHLTIELVTMHIIENAYIYFENVPLLVKGRDIYKNEEG
jgi:hypothetical protein